ncbi:MAG: ribosomal protein L10, large subunit ribosomal protein L10 [Parcubacteria group bacterium GW2011_GWC1_45_9]|nr:MAG: ribosomal protein L10, large subunit ribosomal protein L10 [Parcubacteria group bacterium GW2011_GWC1_45_9]HCI05324.1 50S ribosomal protein L10 [Patescibacteria group bacterium]
MAISRDKKQTIIKDLEKIINDYAYVYFVDLASAKTLPLTVFKKAISGLGAKYKVVKKNLLKIALKKNNFEFPEFDNYSGSFGIVYTNENEMELVKGIDKFIKENNPKIKIKDSLSILAAIFEKAFMPKDKAVKLAKIPSKEILRAQLVNVLISPVAGLAYVLSGTMQNLLLTLKEVEKKKSG